MLVSLSRRPNVCRCLAFLLPLALLLTLPARAETRIDFAVGSTHLLDSELHAVDLGEANFDDSTAEYCGSSVEHLLGSRIDVGGSFRASLSQRGADAQVVSALGTVGWTFLPRKRLSPWIDLGLGACHVHNRHLGISTEGRGPIGAFDAGVRIALVGNFGLSIEGTAMRLRARDRDTVLTTAAVELSYRFGRRGFGLGRPRF
jgi:hypothetical protein